MDSLIFAFNAVAPIITMVAIGYFLKRIGWMSESFAKSANKLVFRLFLPAMLFMNVYKIDTVGSIQMGYIWYSIVVVLVIFAISIPAVIFITHRRACRGVLLQSIFRSNYALIGIPLAQSLFGDSGVMVASLLSAAIIPLFNILAVISLSLFRGTEGKPTKLRTVLMDIVRNPLIQGIAVGVLVLGVRALFVRHGIAFRLSDVPLFDKLLTYLSNMATPLALLVLGAQFEFSAIASLRREIVFGTLIRTVLVPLLGIGTAYLFFADRFTGAHFAAFVAMFGTPVAVSSVPMAQEMDGDVPLAGQLVVWTTLASAFSVFIMAFILRSVGIFS